jgi:hypothetical protein
MLCTSLLVMNGGVHGLAAHPCHICLCLLRLSSVQVPGDPNLVFVQISRDHISTVSHFVRDRVLRYRCFFVTPNIVLSSGITHFISGH